MSCKTAILALESIIKIYQKKCKFNFILTSLVLYLLKALLFLILLSAGYILLSFDKQYICTIRKCLSWLIKSFIDFAINK
jgi:hypothetical protein